MQAERKSLPTFASGLAKGRSGGGVSPRQYGLEGRHLPDGPLDRPFDEDFSAGWAVYSIDFRPNPPLITDPREWEDTALAIRHVRKMPFIDGERVAVEGSSHGANTLSRMISRERVRCAVLCTPAAIDLIEISYAVARGEKVNPQLNRWIAAVEQRSGAKMDEIEKIPRSSTDQSAFTEVAGVNSRSSSSTDRTITPRRFRW